MEMVTSEMERIREQDPLKQGLKLICFIDNFYKLCNSRARSTKTRIETCCRQISSLWKDSRARSTKTRIETYDIFPDPRYIPIREQDPLKQGLKLVTPSSPVPAIAIREQDPLKQGLKPYIIPIGFSFIIEFASKIH